MIIIFLSFLVTKKNFYHISQCCLDCRWTRNRIQSEECFSVFSFADQRLWSFYPMPQLLSPHWQHQCEWKSHTFSLSTRVEQTMTDDFLIFRCWFHGLAFLKVSSSSQLMRTSSSSWKLNVGLVALNHTCSSRSSFGQSLKMWESITLTLRTFLVYIILLVLLHFDF